MGLPLTQHLPPAGSTLAVGYWWNLAYTATANTVMMLGEMLLPWTCTMTSMARGVSLQVLAAPQVPPTTPLTILTP